jgi:hypothetical protein
MVDTINAVRMAMNPEQAPQSWDGTVPGYERSIGSDPETIHKAEYAEERIGELIALKRFAEEQIKVLQSASVVADSAYLKEIQHKINIHQGAAERAQLIINELLDSSGADDKEERTYH